MSTGNNGESTADRDQKGRFAPGNPGRPKGARHRVTRHVEALMADDAEAITRAVIEAAKGGDLIAARLVLDRIAPARREPTVAVDLPEMTTAADLPEAVSAILASVAAGDLSPSEAGRLSGVLADTARALEVHEIEARVSELEGRFNEG